MAGLASSLAGKTGTFQVSCMHIRRYMWPNPKSFLVDRLWRKSLDWFHLSKEASLNQPQPPTSSTEPIYHLPADWPKRCNCFPCNPTQLLLQVLKAGPNIVPTSPLGEALRLLPGETVHTQANSGADVPKVKSWNMPNLFIQRVSLYKSSSLNKKSIVLYSYKLYLRWHLFCS